MDADMAFSFLSTLYITTRSNCCSVHDRGLAPPAVAALTLSELPLLVGSPCDGAVEEEGRKQPRTRTRTRVEDEMDRTCHPESFHLEMTHCSSSLSYVEAAPFLLHIMSRVRKATSLWLAGNAPSLETIVPHALFLVVRDMTPATICTSTIHPNAMIWLVTVASSNELSQRRTNGPRIVMG
jgi:hypothetical protein